MKRHPATIASVRTFAACLAGFLLCLATGCSSKKGTVIKFPASAVGKEREVLEAQLAEFHQKHSDIRVEVQVTPDDANLKHQRFVQWLNARTSDPDLLQLDVIWTAEFASAQWIMPLDRFQPDTGDFFPGTVQACRYDGKVYALPWFVDVGMLYYRTDMIDAPPTTLQALADQASTAMKKYNVSQGFVWQGAAYEGLVCVFVEHLKAFGGQILDDQGKVVVDSDQAVRALTFMRDCIYTRGVVPEATLQWKEDETLSQFLNGHAVFLRNWPYAYAVLQDKNKKSKVINKFAVAAIPPGSPQGQAAATLGGQLLAINAYTDHPEEAYQVLSFLTSPKQMKERARRASQFPPRKSLYEKDQLKGILSIPPQQAVQAIQNATPRPVTPFYAELSGILQISLHQALTRQVEPREALQQAAEKMRAVLARGKS
jgi:multiple sugar transport system substrate-binding protein